jgi:hypothetical protein
VRVPAETQTSATKVYIPEIAVNIADAERRDLIVCRVSWCASLFHPSNGISQNPTGGGNSHAAIVDAAKRLLYGFPAGGGKNPVA